MVVAVQRELTGIIDGLRQRGYEAVVFGEYKLPIAALVYEGRSFSVSNLMGEPLTGTKQFTGDEQGILLVDAAGKSMDEIADILRRKLYSPLF